MPAMRLTQPNVNYLKRKIRQQFPELKSSKASEFTANLLEFKTSIALRTALRDDANTFPRIVHISDMCIRSKLRFPDISSAEVYAFTQNKKFPEPIWMKILNESSNLENTWWDFNQKKSLPYVHITPTDDKFSVEYDTDSVTSKYRSPIAGERGNNIGSIIYNFIEAAADCTGSNWTYSGCAAFGEAKNLNYNAAKLFADAVFEILYTATQRERVKVFVRQGRKELS